MKRVIKDFNKDEIILNTFYQHPDDMLLIVTKNIHTGIKRMKEYDNPKVPIYITLPEFRSGSYREQIKKEEAEEHWVQYKWREYDIARALGINDFAERVRNGELKPKQIYLDKKLFTSDVNIEDMVLREYFKFCLKHDDSGDMVINFPIIDDFHISGLDIETDINVSDNPYEQPVIVNTTIDNKTWTVKTACLINDNYSGQRGIIEDIEGFKKEFKEILYNHIENIDIDEDDPDKKKEKESYMKEMIHSYANQLNLDLTFTEKEEEVMSIPTEYLFKHTHPDFCYIYNAQFDIGHMTKRSEVLGFDFDNMFKYKDKKTYNAFYYNDTSPDPRERKHFYNSHSPTKIIDQLLQYAQLRKSKQYPKYTLDAVTRREIGVAKLDYSKICSYIGDFPYVDYKYFLIYNIIDTFIMLILDKVTNDTYSQVYFRYMLCTEWGRISSSMRRTTNVFDTLSMIQGYLPGNELNGLFLNLEKRKLEKIKNSDPSLYKIIEQLTLANGEDNPFRIKGGCVTDPNLIHTDILTDSIYDIPVKGYKKLVNCADLDATAQYPSNTEANNGSKSTLYGMMTSVNGGSSETLSQELALALINENFCSIGQYFFNLPTVEELLQEYHNITPIYKKRISDIYGFNEEEEWYYEDSKDLSKYRTLINKLFKPKFNDKDKEAGAPSLSSYLFSDDSNKISLAYYNTLIELELVGGYKTFNEMCDFVNKGFICGKSVIKDKKIINYNNDYISYMIPETEYPKLSEVKYKRIITDEERANLTKAKIMPYNLKLGDYNITLTNRSIFWDNSSEELNVEIYDLLEDTKMSLAKFTTSYKINNTTKLIVNQHIVFFKL